MFLISLGGLSESGKSSVGIYLSELGFNRIKIINIEKELMVEKGIISKNDAINESHFERLYENSSDACHEFTQKLKKRIGEQKLPYASIESIYRPELHLHLKKELGKRYQCLYFEAPLSKRIERELYRLKNKEKICDIDYETVSLMVKNKDEFKVKHQADQIKNFADYIVDNSGTKEQLYRKVDAILKSHGIKK